MPYMILEGCHSKAVRLLDVYDVNGYVYLSVQELLTAKNYSLSWNMDFDGGYWLWCIADFQTITNLQR